MAHFRGKIKCCNYYLDTTIFLEENSVYEKNCVASSYTSALCRVVFDLEQRITKKRKNVEKIKLEAIVFFNLSLPLRKCEHVQHLLTTTRKTTVAVTLITCLVWTIRSSTETIV